MTVTFPRPVEVVTPHVTPHVERLVAALQGEMSRAELMDTLGLTDRRHFARTYLQSGLEAGLVEMTLPDSPRSRMQKYRLTALGRQMRDSQQGAGDARPGSA